MCRLLVVKAEEEFETRQYLEKFAEISKSSMEFQGHGWGCARLDGDRWKIYRNIRPVWEDSLEGFGKTKLLLAHARSAFQDTGITIENNMPFDDGKHVFIFNGELRGVRIKAEGRIGAEKIFNYIRSFYKGDMRAAIEKAVPVIRKRTRRIRAMNFVIADSDNVYVSSFFNEDPEYFTLRRKAISNGLVLCSEAFSNEKGWINIENEFMGVF
jgi:predicted glutamine amidotransferase